MPGPTRKGRKRQRPHSRLGVYAKTVTTEDVAFVAGRRTRLGWSRLAGLVLCLGNLWLLGHLFSDSRFRVTEIAVSGASLVDEADIRGQLDVMDKSILRVRPDELEVVLVRGFGCIEEAVVDPRLPNRVSVKVREQPVELVWESGGRYWWIGDEGRVLGATDDPGHLVVVHDPGGLSPDPEGYIVGVPWPFVRDTLSLLPGVTECEFALDVGLVVHVTAGRWPIYFGYQGEPSSKIALMQAIVDQLGDANTQVQYLDLRDDLRPILKKG